MKDLEINEGSSLKKFEKNVATHMDKQVDHFKKELAKLRTGRANPNMIEDLQVNAYGSVVRLKEVSAIAAPEPQLLTVQPWDKSLINEVEKAIMSSDLNLNPQNDGHIIRIQIPHMSQERRQELVKILNQKLESAKVALRNVRKEALNTIRSKEKDKEISEDYSKQLQDSLQKVVNSYITKVSELATEKEKEIKG